MLQTTSFTTVVPGTCYPLDTNNITVLTTNVPKSIDLRIFYNPINLAATSSSSSSAMSCNSTTSTQHVQTSSKMTQNQQKIHLIITERLIVTQKVVKDLTSIISDIFSEIPTDEGLCSPSKEQRLHIIKTVFDPVLSHCIEKFYQKIEPVLNLLSEKELEEFGCEKDKIDASNNSVWKKICDLFPKNKMDVEKLREEFLEEFSEQSTSEETLMVALEPLLKIDAQ